MKDMLKQAGAVPYRHGPHGVEVLLVTSKGTGRWVIPKGNISKGDSAFRTAEREAREEAGVTGTIDENPLGRFTYSKQLASGEFIPAAVEVFGLEVARQLKNWPERTERQFQWMSVQQAVEAVSEPGMKEILRQLGEVVQGHAKSLDR